MANASNIPDLIAHDRGILGCYEEIVGVDEAGRGALAGPVVAGAVWANQAFLASDWVNTWGKKVNDSKQLKEPEREAIFEAILQAASDGLLKFAAGEASVQEIETLNILKATGLAMNRALQTLQSSGVHLENSRALILLDGKPMRTLKFSHQSIVKGDAKSLVIALGSIVAKVTRDRGMCSLAQAFPAYGFETHKGYGTLFHREKIQQNGPSVAHRTLFLRKLLPPQQQELGI